MSKNRWQGKGKGSYRGVVVLVLASAALLYFMGLGGYPLLDPDEGRYAEIPREMLESGDFITPYLNYVKYFEKPPLFYWCVAGSMALFGENEWAVRMVPAMAGFLTVLLIMALGTRLFGVRVGVMASWVYLTSLVPLILARLPIIDGLFSLLLTATWGAWWVGYVTPAPKSKRGWYCTAWGCMGLATMTKGIAAIALTGLIVFGFMALRRDWAAIRSMAWLPGLSIFAVLVLPWHVAAWFQNPEFAHFYFVVQHFGRLVSEEHAKPFWFFPVIFPFGMLFWTALFFPAIAKAFVSTAKTLRLSAKSIREKSRETHAQTGAEWENAPRAPETVLFLVLWMAVVVGLFSLSSGKLVPYILPAYPAMALLIGLYLTDDNLKGSPARWCTGITAALLLLLIPVVSYYLKSQDMIPVGELTWAARTAQGALLFGSGVLCVGLFKRRLIPFATGLVLMALLPTMVMTVPVVANYRKVGGFMRAMPSPLPGQVKIAEWRTYDQGLSFYSRRRTILVDNIGELRFGSTLGNHERFFLKGEESLKRLAAEGPLLVNLRPGDWPRVRGWGIFHPVAANSTNILVGNEGLFRVTGLIPWPDNAITPPPLFLLPRHGSPAESG